MTAYGTDEKSILVPVMAKCRQDTTITRATIGLNSCSHMASLSSKELTPDRYLNQLWPDVYVRESVTMS